MTISFEHTPPDASFWEAYAGLWQQSATRSPFQAPHLLQVFADRAEGPIARFECRNDGKLLAVALFQRTKGAYSFLSDQKTDHNFFVIHRDCGEGDVREIFQGFLKIVEREKGAFVLNNQPVWAPYMVQFREVLETSPLFSENLPYSVCPIIEETTPKALFERVHGLREFRYRTNKLVNQQNAIFEALETDEELEKWVDQFCDAHIRRWDGTPTPSAFLDPDRIRFLQACMRAWQDDGILVRFSARVGEKRVGFVVGLKQGKTLVHHSTTFDPDFRKYSPGIALIHVMAEWMSKNDYTTLDFGDGDEPYKYTVANEEHHLHRIFLSGRYNLPFILKTKMIKSVRNNPGLFGFYRDKIKPLAQRLHK